MRSTIETTFGDFSNLFQYFGPKSNIYALDLKIIHLKYKFCWFLWNIKLIVDNYNIQ
jgi:hypothetical protein